MADVQAALYAAAELAGRFSRGGQRADDKKRKRADAHPPAPPTGLRAEEEPEEANATHRKRIKAWEKDEHEDEGEDAKQKGMMTPEELWVPVAKVKEEESDDELWLPPLADQAHMGAVQKAMGKAEDTLERLDLVAHLRRQFSTIISAKHEIRYTPSHLPATLGLSGAEPWWLCCLPTAC
jgi:hypothetical protein